MHALDRYLANDVHQVIVLVTPTVFLDSLFVGGKPFQIELRHIPLSIEIPASDKLIRSFFMGSYSVPFKVSPSCPLLTSVSDFAGKITRSCSLVQKKDLHAEAPVQTEAKHIFLQRVTCPSTDPYPFPLCAEILGNAIFHAGACR